MRRGAARGKLSAGSAAEEVDKRKEIWEINTVSAMSGHENGEAEDWVVAKGLSMIAGV